MAIPRISTHKRNKYGKIGYLLRIKIINKSQSSFIKGRYIGDTIRSLLEVIDLAEEENLSCIALSIDFEKAFDTFSWKFKKKILSFFNFGKLNFLKYFSLISMIKSNNVTNITNAEY
jgi:hypothetical protein